MAGDKFSGGLDEHTRQSAKQLFSNLKGIVAGIGELPAKAGSFLGFGGEKGAEAAESKGESWKDRLMAAITGESLDVKEPVEQPKLGRNARNQEMLASAGTGTTQYDVNHNDIVVPNVQSNVVRQSAGLNA
jgi:hypothetical protein